MMTKKFEFETASFDASKMFDASDIVDDAPAPRSTIMPVHHDLHGLSVAAAKQSGMTHAEILDAYFPAVEPGMNAVGDHILLQIMTLPKKIGSIFIPDSTQEDKQLTATVAKVISVGGSAYSDYVDGKTWAGGAWCKVGDYVRLPAHGGHRFQVKTSDGLSVNFMHTKDNAVLGIVSAPFSNDFA